MKNILAADKITPGVKNILGSVFIIMLVTVIELILYFQQQYFKPCQEFEQSYHLQFLIRVLQIQVLSEYFIFLIFQFQDKLKIQDKNNEKMSIVLYLISTVSFIGAFAVIFFSEITKDQNQDEKCGDWIQEIKENPEQEKKSLSTKVFIIGVLLIVLNISMYIKVSQKEQRVEENNKIEIKQEMV